MFFVVLFSAFAVLNAKTPVIIGKFGDDHSCEGRILLKTRSISVRTQVIVCVAGKAYAIATLVIQSFLRICE